MATLRLKNVGANCVRPKKYVYRQTENPFLKGFFLFRVGLVQVIEGVYEFSVHIERAESNQRNVMIFCEFIS